MNIYTCNYVYIYIYTCTVRPHCFGHREATAARRGGRHPACSRRSRVKGAKSGDAFRVEQFVELAHGRQMVEFS